VATGETVFRETPLPGAVLARVAASHLRVGTFQFFAARGDTARLQRLADYAIARHDADLAGSDDRYARFLDRVIARTMDLVAQWMAVGFVHGVMNTDNTAVSGETIDYGPCAFLDAYDPMAVFSSIDTHGRYAYSRQPVLAQWNLARLAETLLPLMAPANPESALPIAQAAIERAPSLYADAYRKRFAAKLGIEDSVAEDDGRIDGFLELLGAAKADFTLGFRALAAAARGSDTALWAQLKGAPGLEDWLADWRARIAAGPGGAEAAAERMAATNPVYIARNHRVEAALAAAQQGDLAPTHRLLAALSAPFTPRAEFADLESPAPEDFGPYVTFCGT